MERWNKLLAALMVVALAAGLFIAGSLVSSSTGAAPPDAAQALMAQASAEEQDIRVQVDGRYLSFDVPPMIENGRTLVPLRALFEALGAEVQWDGETQTVSAVKGDVTVRLTIGSNVA
ncbi:MAG: copper amine oxidase N-terminal domain-containing protein, partial [Desulfotomaculales bacterium]